MFRLWWRLSLLGLIGVASFLFVPLETWDPFARGFDPLALRLLSTIQPAVFVLVLTAVGAWAAPKVGLRAPAVQAWADGRPIMPQLRRQLSPAIITGIVVAAILVGYALVIGQVERASSLLRFSPPLPTRLFYGGLSEELLLRWGVMSLLVWTAWRLAARPAAVPPWILWTGIVLSAFLFGLGHLPALFFLLPDPPIWLVPTVVAANFTAGMLFGWLFWWRGLEAAMMAHALAHLFAWTALLAL